jgi:hypothetical protein
MQVHHVLIDHKPPPKAPDYYAGLSAGEPVWSNDPREAVIYTTHLATTNAREFVQRLSPNRVVRTHGLTQTASR